MTKRKKKLKMTFIYNTLFTLLVGITNRVENHRALNEEPFQLKTLICPSMSIQNSGVGQAAVTMTIPL